MDELLSPVSTTYLKRANEGESFLSEVTSTKTPKSLSPGTKISSADDVIEILGQQPGYDLLIAVLRFLTTKTRSSNAFSLQTPGPKSAAIVHLLVSEITPNYWTLLQEGSETQGDDNQTQSEDARLLVQCLQSVTGLNAVLAHTRALIQQFDHGKDGSRRPDLPLIIGVFLDLLSTILDGNSTIQDLWLTSTGALPDPALSKVQSQSLLSLICNGKVVSVVAEAQSKLERQAKRRWVADGIEYSKWVGQNIASWAKKDPNGIALQFCHDLLQRGMSLGYPESLVKVVIEELLLSRGIDPILFNKVSFHQPQSSKRIIHILMDFLSQRFMNNLKLDDASPNATVSAVAGILQKVVGQDESRKKILIDWCTSSSGAGIGASVGLRRAVLAALSKNTGDITSVLEKSLAQFGDELYIKHAPILQQQVHTQILLISAGYVHRLSPIKLRMLVRSSTYLSTISNRIAATQARTRVLGMIIGESLSALVDGKEKRLDFKMEETETEDAQWLQSLTNVSDPVGPVEALLSESSVSDNQKKTISQPQQRPAKRQKPKPKPPTTTLKPRPIIEEIDSDDEEEDDDLVPYAKNSDPEDSDEDATLVQRNKLKPPVYVRELVAFFRDSESYDKQKLALQTAPLLIRRKANFGTEVSSHADQLAALIVGVQDKFDIDNFNDLKLQGMIALVVAQPKSMAPWFAKTFFEGDYSLSQRTTVLVTLGLSARELAGFETSEDQSDASFPSKRLPEKMEQLYLTPSKEGDNRLPPSQLKALPPTALDTIAASLTSSFLAPLAASAADANSGPDILKLQSFTARYKSKQMGKPRVRSIPNTTAALLANYFFSPLTAHFQVALRSSRPMVLNPGLLTLYLQTLGIVIHAAGPSTLSLPQLTSELWDLLLGVRVHVMGDLSAMRGWLVAMASLLDVNEGDMRRLCESQGRQVMETREWVGGVFERTRGEDGGEENDVKMLAAGVLIKLGEAIEKYQALLMGDMLSFP